VNWWRLDYLDKSSGSLAIFAATRRAEAAAGLAAFNIL
jgi:hypothetical protein